ncbi:MAG: M15 family metallopeptidase [Acidobacteriota bacterium]
MRVLKLNTQGADVKRWQLFLIGQKFDPGAADGKFGKKTAAATIDFQTKNKLPGDGFVGNQTLGKALLLGFGIVEDPTVNGNVSASFPPLPNFSPLVGTAARQAVFGKFAFKHQPVPGNRENIVITDNWENTNIVKVQIPQLAGVKGAPSSGKVRFHKLAAKQFADLWAAWETANLLDRVLSWEGSFVPRFQRGSVTTLSNHAFGSAFDINAAFNSLGAVPKLVGEKGSVRELVQIANAHGFYWGGHFKNRKDGMHFEVAVIK